MKKLNILLAGLVALGLASCDDKTDFGVMQTNPQEAIMEANGLKVDYGTAIAGSSIDLTQYENKTVPVITLVEAENLPTDAVVSFVMQVSADQNFSNYKELKVTDGAVSADDWDAAFIALIGNSPLPATNYVRFAAYATTVNDNVRIGGQDFYYATKQLTVTPYDLGLPIEPKYYVILDGNDPVEMTHSSKHVYDDPVFTMLIDVTAEQAQEGYTWVIVPESALNGSEENYYGVADTGDPAAIAGGLALMSNGGQTGVITSAGPQKITVNMLDLSYSITFAIDYIYTPGPANGWGFENNMLLFTNDYVNYNGYVYVQEQFKMTGQPAWSPLDWGGDGAGNMVSGGPNIVVPADGLYWITANLDELKYTVTEITMVGMIGGFNSWGGDVEMTTTDYKTYTGTLTVEEPTEFKFRFNGGWDLDLGGTEDELTPGGPNLVITEAGTYEVKLMLGSLPYTCTVVKE